MAGWGSLSKATPLSKKKKTRFVKAPHDKKSSTNVMVGAIWEGPPTKKALSDARGEKTVKI